MKRLLIAGVVLVGVTASLVASGAFASVKAKKVTPKVEASTVAVKAGEPVPYAFSLSTMSVKPGPVVFKVTNKGSLLYAFEICSGPGNANVCFGDSTPVIDPGKTVTLSVKLPKGKYEFIGTAGAYVTEKGNLTVTATAKATPKTTVPAASTGKSTKPSGSATGSSSPGSSTGTPGATTTPAGGATAPAANNVGDPVAGAGLFQQAGCGGCHTLKAAGATGTVGPNLDQVAPDENTVITNVTFGNAMGMPAFSPQFSTTQIQNIAAYVYQSTH